MNLSPYVHCLTTGSHPRVALASLGLLPLLFVLDRYLPMGVAVGVLYVLPVLLTQWSLPCLTLAVSVLSSILILLDISLSPSDTVTWMAMLNRVFALAIVWMTAGVVYMRQRAERHIQTVQAGLEQKVAERTAHLAELNQCLQEEATERLQAEEDLRESTARFRAMVETTSDWVWELDAQGVYTYASRKGLEFLGYAPEDVLGRTMMDFMPPEEAERFGKALQSIYAARVPFRCLENINRHRDGHLVVLETSGVPIFDTAGEFRGFRGIDRDVSERKAVERTLRESEQHLRQIIDLVPHRIFAKDIEGRFLLANRAAAAAYGLAPENLIGRCHRELHDDPQQVERMLADDRAVIEKGETRINAEESFTGADGVQRVLRTTKIPYRIPGQERTAVLGMAMDITEEKLNERRLVASEQKYRAILENAVDAIFLTEMDGRLVDANRRACELLGYSKDELLQMTAEGLHPVEERERLHEIFGRLANDDTTLVVHPVLRKDGSVIYCEVAATPIHIGDIHLAQGIFRDVTERERRSQARLEQERRHRDTLVREVHHRIKNNLQGVVGLLREHANAHPEIADVIGSAIGQVQSISVVHGLHGQGADLQVRLCDMVQAIARNASTLTRAAVEPDVQLAIERPVQVDSEEAVPLALIINELILNAVKHGSRGSGKPQVTVRLIQAGQTAEISVMNPGGLPPGFDFRQGKGSGTGLGLVRSLLPHAGAELQLETTADGVCARLKLAPPVVSV